MSTATKKKLITAEEFMRMPDPPDGSQQELVRGVIITMPPPKGLHGLCCAKVTRLVGNHVDLKKLGYVTSNDDRSRKEPVILEENETLSGGDVLPGFSCKVAELFA